MEKSAKKGHVASQLQLGDVYYNGLGVDVNLKKAAKWYYEATIQGNETAKQKHSRIHDRTYNRADYDREIAIYLLEKPV